MDSNRKLGKVLFGIDEWVRERLDVEAAPDVDTLLVNVLPLKETYGEIAPYASSYSLQCCGTFDIPRSFVMEMIESTLSNVSFMYDMSKNSIDIHPAIVDTAAMLR